ncbi:MAG: NAD(P)-dependent oxidoreductase [Armatimonadetes bacterium]|nr:NAD(P)-dependent oxidoreductase [Armatimonadota bacterium]
MKVLITGAAGWLARELATELEGGHELRLTDRVDPAEATVFVPGQLERQAAPLASPWPYVRAEITDLTAMTQAAEGVDAIVHLAAATNGLPENGPAIMQANVVGTYVVFDAARLAGVRRVLCASSVNALGTIYWRLSGQPAPYAAMPVDETFRPVPEDPYSLSKWCNEETAHAFARAYGLTTAAFRFAGVWTPELYERHLANMGPTTAWSDDLYQWVHVSDVVRGLRQALECEALPASGVYHLGAADTRCPEPTMELLARFRPDLAVTTALPGRSPLLSIDLARRTFGYEPRMRLGE